MIKLTTILSEIRVMMPLRKLFDSIKVGDYVEYKSSMEDGKIRKMKVGNVNILYNKGYLEGISDKTNQRTGEYIPFRFDESPDSWHNREAITVKKVNN